MGNFAQQQQVIGTAGQGGFAGRRGGVDPDIARGRGKGAVARRARPGGKPVGGGVIAKQHHRVVGETAAIVDFGKAEPCDLAELGKDGADRLFLCFGELLKAGVAVGDRVGKPIGQRGGGGAGWRPAQVAVDQPGDHRAVKVGLGAKAGRDAIAAHPARGGKVIAAACGGGEGQQGIALCQPVGIAADQCGAIGAVKLQHRPRERIRPDPHHGKAVALPRHQIDADEIHIAGRGNAAMGRPAQIHHEPRRR